MISLARAVAHSVLMRVEEGGYASDLLMAQTAELDSRDAGLASEIVFGCLRRQAQLDSIAESIAGRSSKSWDAAVLVALRMGIYQIRHLDRVPRHAAVSESVELVKRARKTSAAGFVNAVLRKVARDAVEWPDRATALSMPQWILDRWDKQFGRETADRIAEEFLLQPETYVRSPPDRPGIELEVTDVPGAYRVVRGDVTGLRIQDIGSQAIIPMLRLAAGQSFLDVCAAPGNKTAQALESGVQAIACDLHAHRLRNVRGCARVLVDATGSLPFKSLFDRILVDAPCSGTGTLGRNPEIRWRLKPPDLGGLQKKQRLILRNAWEALKPGGRLVYSTCSLEPEENEEVVEGWPVLETVRRTPGMNPGDGFFAAVIDSGPSRGRDVEEQGQSAGSGTT